MAKDVTRNVYINYLVGKNEVMVNTQKVKAAFRGMGGVIDEVSQRSRGSLRDLAGAYNALITAKHAARAIGSMLAPAVRMQSALKDLSVVTGLSSDNLDVLKKAAHEAAAITPFDPAEAIDAAKRLNLVLRDTGTTAAALGPTMALAATFMDNNLGAATQMVTRLMGSFALSGDQAAATIDRLAIGARAIGVQVKDLTQGFKTLSVSATTLRSDFDDVYLGFLLAVRGGLAASNAATLMATVTQRLARKTVQNTLQDLLGVTVKQGGQFLGFSDILLQLAEAYERLGPERAVDYAFAIQQAFGARTGKVMIPMIAQIVKGVRGVNDEVFRGANLLRYYREQIGGASGALTKMTAEAMTPLQRRLAILKETWNILLTELLLPTVDAITPIVGSIISLVKAMSHILEIAPGIRMVAAALLRLGSVFMTVAAGAMIWKGAAAIVGMAFRFIGANAGSATLGFRVFMQTMVAAQGTAMKLGVVMGGLGKAIRMLFGSFFGIAGLALTFLPEILSWAKKLFGFGEDKGAKKASKAQANLAQSVNKIKRPVAELGDTAVDLKELMKEWKRVNMQKLPMPNTEAVRELRRKIGETAASERGRRVPGGMALLRQDFATIEALQKLIAKGKPIKDPKRLLDAQKTLGHIIETMQILFPHSKRFLKGLNDTRQAYIDMAANTKKMVESGDRYNLFAKDTIAVNRELLSQAQGDQKRALDMRRQARAKLIENISLVFGENYMKVLGRMGLVKAATEGVKVAKTQRDRTGVQGGMLLGVAENLQHWLAVYNKSAADIAGAKKQVTKSTSTIKTQMAAMRAPGGHTPGAAIAIAKRSGEALKIIESNTGALVKQGRRPPKLYVDGQEVAIAIAPRLAAERRRGRSGGDMVREAPRGAN